MDRSPLHPLRLLPALPAPAEQGRKHFENEMGQWLAEQAEKAAQTSAKAPKVAAAATDGRASAASHPALGLANVPNTGETIPEAGQ
jgi:hypothetical protein